MSLRRLAALQWVGLGLGGAAWATQLVVGYGLTEAQCRQGGPRWSLGNDAWQAGLMAGAVLSVLVAEAAAVTVLRRTSGAEYVDGPPVGRIRFLAIAAAAANLIFLVGAVLQGTASIVDVACRQS